MKLLSSTELQECGHTANFCHECEGDLNTCGFNGEDHGERAGFTANSIQDVLDAR